MFHRIALNGTAPAANQAIEQVYAVVRETGLDAGLLGLVSLRVSQINGCDACIDRHSRDLTTRGFPLFKLLLVPFWHDSGHFDARERAALAWAEIATTFADDEPPQSAHELVGSQFSEEELVGLTGAIGLINLSNRLTNGFGSAAIDSK